MGDAHGGVRPVDVLAAVAGSAVGVNADFLGLDVDLDILDFWQHGHGRRAGVDTRTSFLKLCLVTQHTTASTTAFLQQ